MKRLVISGVILLLSLITFAQDFLAKNEYFFSLTNGLDMLVVRFFCKRYFAWHGVSMRLLDGKRRVSRAFLHLRAHHDPASQPRDGEQIIPEHKLVPCGIQGQQRNNLTKERTFRLVFPKNHLVKVLEAINRVVLSPFTGDEIKEAADYSNSEYQSKMLAPSSFSLAQKIGNSLWENDYKKRITINTWNDSTTALIPQKIAKFREKYFCPGNCFIVIKGNVTHKVVYAEVQDQSVIFASDKNLAFEHWPKCTINPLAGYPVSRLPITGSFSLPGNWLMRTRSLRLRFSGWHFPVLTLMKTGAAITARWCSAILASPASKIHRLLEDSCGLASMSLHNDLAKYISQITFEFSAKNSNEATGYECFRSFLMNMTDSILTEEDLTLGKDIVISNFRANQADNAAHVSQIIKFWSSVTLNDYSTFEDSIRSVSINDMKVMFKRYFYGRHYVAALSIQPQLRQSLHIDTTFTATKNDIKSYRIDFMKNSKPSLQVRRTIVL